MVFKGNAELKDYPGNYTDYREWSDLEEEQIREAKKNTKTKAVAPKVLAVPKEKVSKKSFKDKQEFESLEKEIQQLESEKADIEKELSSGALKSEAIIEASQRFTQINVLIDEKTMRWMELSE